MKLSSIVALHMVSLYALPSVEPDATEMSNANILRNNNESNIPNSETPQPPAIVTENLPNAGDMHQVEFKPPEVNGNSQYKESIDTTQLSTPSPQPPIPPSTTSAGYSTSSVTTNIDLAKTTPIPNSSSSQQPQWDAKSTNTATTSYPQSSSNPCVTVMVNNGEPTSGVRLCPTNGVSDATNIAIKPESTNLSSESPKFPSDITTSGQEMTINTPSIWEMSDASPHPEEEQMIRSEIPNPQSLKLVSASQMEPIFQKLMLHPRSILPYDLGIKEAFKNKDFIPADFFPEPRMGRNKMFDLVEDLEQKYEAFTHMIIEDEALEETTAKEIPFQSDMDAVATSIGSSETMGDTRSLLPSEATTRKPQFRAVRRGESNSDKNHPRTTKGTNPTTNTHQSDMEKSPTGIPKPHFIKEFEKNTGYNFDFAKYWYDVYGSNNIKYNGPYQFNFDLDFPQTDPIYELLQIPKAPGSPFYFPFSFNYPLE